eukprot:5320098-Amphidinium_carterae.1
MAAMVKSPWLLSHARIPVTFDTNKKRVRWRGGGCSAGKERIILTWTDSGQFSQVEWKQLVSLDSKLLTMIEQQSLI